MARSRDFLVEVARNYYIDEMSQQEIAKKYGISRPTVSNILSQCRETGIVEIRIQDGTRFTGALEERIRNTFGLKEVFIVPSDADYPLTLSRTSSQAADFLASLLADKIRIGISWGTALYQMIRHLSRSNIVDSEVVQLMGGLGASAPSYDGSELARILAGKINGRYYPFLAPLLVQTPELKNMLLSEPGIRETLAKAENLDLALVGLSSNRPEDSALVRAGLVSAAEAQDLTDQGTCGNLCGHHFDCDGRLMDIPINQRVVGIEFSKFIKIPRRIGIACGKQKARAIYAALRGSLLTDLVTDEAAALQILSLCE